MKVVTYLSVLLWAKRACINRLLLILNVTLWKVTKKPIQMAYVTATKITWPKKPRQKDRLYSRNVCKPNQTDCIYTSIWYNVKVIDIYKHLHKFVNIWSFLCNMRWAICSWTYVIKSMDLKRRSKKTAFLWYHSLIL